MTIRCRRPTGPTARHDTPAADSISSAQKAARPMPCPQHLITLFSKPQSHAIQGKQQQQRTPAPSGSHPLHATPASPPPLLPLYLLKSSSSSASSSLPSFFSPFFSAVYTSFPFPSLHRLILHIHHLLQSPSPPIPPIHKLHQLYQSTISTNPPFP